VSLDLALIVNIYFAATTGCWLWIKCATFAKTEVARMKYVANHTDISVPRVWFSFKWGVFGYIVMDRFG
jgi:hypothetical protein